MDERHASPRRRDPGSNPVTAVGLAALGVATLAAVALAGAGLQDDPLGTVTTSRLIPELVIAAVVVTVLIGLTLWLLLPAAPSTRSPAERSGGSLWPRLAGMLAGFVLIGVLLVLVQRLTEGTESAEVSTRPETETAETVEPETDQIKTSTSPRSESPSPVVPVSIAVGGAVAVLLLAAGAVRAATGHRAVPDDDMTDDPVAGPGRTGPARSTLAEALEHVEGTLALDNDPRLAVIEAYWSLEQAMIAAGLPPSPAETSSEFLARCLEPLGAGAEGARRLTLLFEWAMFSRRPMDDSTRAEARQALRGAIDALDPDTPDAAAVR